MITNHNKFDEGEYKALKKSGRKEGILILPGVELSVKEANGIHTLIAMPGAHWRCMNCRLQSLVSVLESQAMRKLCIAQNGNCDLGKGNCHHAERGGLGFLE